MDNDLIRNKNSAHFCNQGFQRELHGYSTSKNNNHNSVNFVQNAYNSLKEVECFLNNFKHCYKYIYLYKFLK